MAFHGTHSGIPTSGIAGSTGTRIAMIRVQKSISAFWFEDITESTMVCFYRDAKILTIGEGASEILKYVIARQLGLTE